MENFEVIRILGEGAYSQVFHVRRLIDDEDYALKQVKLEKLDEKMLSNTLTEVRILASIKNPFVCSYKEAFLD